MLSDIKIRTLVGSGMTTYLQSMTKVRHEVFSEIPYFQPWGLEADLTYLKHLSQSPDAIAVLVFDGSKMVGVSTGIPLDEELPSFQEPFIKLGLPLKEYYYCGLSALLKPYRNRGLAHHFFDLREKHALHLKRFSKICFASILFDPKLSSSIPLANLEMFWKKQGYIEHAEMLCYPPLLDYNSRRAFKFWIKQLVSSPSPQVMDTELSALVYD